MWAIPAALAGFTDVSATSGPVGQAGARLVDGGGAVLDYDEDGDWDLLVPGETGAALLESNGLQAGPVFTDVTASKAIGLFTVDRVRGLLAADVSNDGLPDLVMVTRDTVDIFLNNGPPSYDFGSAGSADTHFGDAETVGATNFEGAGLIDHDGDGDLDLLVTNSTDGNEIFVNDADGTSWTQIEADVSLGLGVPSASDFAGVGDFDSDGNTDIIARSTLVGNNVFRNLGGTFTEVAGLDQTAANDDKGSVVFCDPEGDGDLDVFWSNNDEDRFYTWNGADLQSGVDPDVEAEDGVQATACGDLDNDGFLDLVYGDASGDQWVRQDSAGGFSGELLPTPVVSTVAVLPFDMDGDGDLDLFLGGDPNNQLLRNDEVDNLGDHLQVRVLAAVRDCSAGRALRDDLGAQALVRDATGATVVGGRQEVGAGVSRGTTGWPVLHWGGLDPAVEVLVEVDLRAADAAVVQVPVTPADLGTPHRMEVRSDDPDADDVLTVDEAVGDTDGDGYDDFVDRDADGDGLDDATEAGDRDPCTPPVDSDGDTIPDLRDLDSDDGGAPDADELAAGTDPTDPSDDAGVPIDTGTTPTDTGTTPGTTPTTPRDTGEPTRAPPAVPPSGGGGAAGCGCRATDGAAAWLLVWSAAALSRRRAR